MSIEQEELKRYLYAEMSREESDALEEKLFLDDALFYETVDLENRLVDRYAGGKLSAAETLRFERSLEKSPERKQKAANAVALRNYIEEERAPIASVAAQTEIATPTFWRKLADIFTIESPLLGSAMAGLLVIFTIAGVFLVLDSRRKGQELARLQNEKEAIETLQNQIADTEKRLTELNNQLETRDEERDELIKTLGSDQQRIQQLQGELEKPRPETNKPLPPTPKPAAPTIASILLSPTLGARGGTGDKVKTASLAANTKKLAINLSLSDEVKKEDKLSISLNEKPFLQNVAPRVSADGKKSVSLTIPTGNLPEGANKLTVNDSEGKEITKYIFNVDKSKE